MLPRFADLAPTSAIIWLKTEIDSAFFRIDSFRFFAISLVVLVLQQRMTAQIPLENMF